MSRPKCDGWMEPDFKPKKTKIWKAVWRISHIPCRYGYEAYVHEIEKQCKKKHYLDEKARWKEICKK